MFKIGTTSYIYPDKILPNIEKLKGEVDDIELLLFERNPFKELTPADMEQMGSISRDYGLTYTVHLPLELTIASGDSIQRMDSIDEIVSIINATIVLRPYAYVMHVKMEDFNRKDTLRESLSEILRLTKIEPNALCIENTNYSLAHIQPAIEALNLSVCLDIGHLIQYNESIKANLYAYIQRIKIIHLCGIDAQGRHLSLAALPAPMREEILQDIQASAFQGVLTLEVFSENEYRESRILLDEALRSMRSISIGQRR